MEPSDDTKEPAELMREWVPDTGTASASCESISARSTSEAARFRVKREGGDSGVSGPSSCLDCEGLAVRRERVDTAVDVLLLRVVLSPFPETWWDEEGSDISISSAGLGRVDARQTELGARAVVYFQETRTSLDRHADDVKLGQYRRR